MEACTHRQNGDEVKEKKSQLDYTLGLLTGVMMFVSAMITQRWLRGTITRKMQEIYEDDLVVLFKEWKQNWCGWRPRSEEHKEEYMTKLLEEEEGSLSQDQMV